MSRDNRRICDAESGSFAEITVGYGFNCHRVVFNSRKGAVDVIWSVPEFATKGGRPSGNGIPVLFPFPGRIRGTEFVWEGVRYTLPEADGRGNAIHGFVHARAWTIVDACENRLTARFVASQNDPQLLNLWPSDFEITATYEIGDCRLTMEFDVRNPGPRALPCGFGVHPYFRLPLVAGPVEDCRIRLPVAAEWQLIDMLPTGKTLCLPDAVAYQNGKRFGDLELDHVFTQLLSANGSYQAVIDDPPAEHRLSIAFDPPFRECVVFTPPHREAICIEPYSCIPDAIRLAAQGVDTGLQVLETGQIAHYRLAIALQSISS